MRNVIPYIGYIFIGCKIQCSLKARYSMIVLLSIKAAEPKIIEQLGIVYTHLQETSERRNIYKFNKVKYKDLLRSKKVLTIYLYFQRFKLYTYCIHIRHTCNNVKLAPADHYKSDACLYWQSLQCEKHLPAQLSCNISWTSLYYSGPRIYDSSLSEL